MSMITPLCSKQEEFMEASVIKKLIDGLTLTFWRPVKGVGDPGGRCACCNGRGRPRYTNHIFNYIISGTTSEILARFTKGGAQNIDSVKVW